MAHSQVPKFGNWENEEDVPYTVYFGNAGKGKQSGKMNPNDPQEYPDAEMMKVKNGQVVTKPNQTRPATLEGGELRRSTDSPLHTDAITRKSATGSPRQMKGGSRYASNRSELDGALDMHRPRHERQLSREEGDMRKPVDAPLRNENANRRSAHDSPHHRHGGTSDGETPKRFGRHSVGSDRSIEYSPRHSNSNARAGGKGSAMSSPSWERKGGLSEDGHGVAPSTPGRSRLRSVTRGDETPDNSPAVPKFGDWDESDPASGEGYSQIFSRVREEKHNVAGKVPLMPTETSYFNGQKRIATASSKGCGCFPWSR